MKLPVISLLMFLPVITLAQQRADTTFAVTIENPTYKEGKGPEICIDSAHYNFHTANGGYAPFSRIVEKDGYQVVDFDTKANRDDLSEKCDIFMVVNPLHESNTSGNWRLPNPSAFTSQEIDAIKRWVENGGRFFLIADHMPFAGAASDLAKAFGFEYSNGFARFGPEQQFPETFTKQNGRLLESTVSEGINKVTSFTGSAFTYPEQATPVMIFKEQDISLEPEIAWQFNDSTKTISLEGYSQGAIMGFGEGKLAVFGEAAMFTAQMVQTDQGSYNFGLNNQEVAPQNIEFLLNLIHWLDEGR